MNPGFWNTETSVKPKSTLGPTSFPGFSPTRPENPGNEVALGRGNAHKCLKIFDECCSLLVDCGAKSEKIRREEEVATSLFFLLYLRLCTVPTILTPGQAIPLPALPWYRKFKADFLLRAFRSADCRCGYH